MTKLMEAERTAAPPYLPWKTFIGFLTILKKTAIPQRIDRSVMPGFSGSNKSQLLATLRFLGLIAEDGTVTDDLRRLVNAVGLPEQWKEVLADMLYPPYSNILGDLDLNSGTAQQLVERFRTIGKLDGSALRKAVAFFLAANASAGLTMSPHFITRGMRTGAVMGTRPRNKPNGQSGKPKNASNGDSRGDTRHKPPPLAEGMMRLPFVIPLKGESAVDIPQNITDAEWGMIDSYVRSYIKLHHTK
jgi:hypothetical protein